MATRMYYSWDALGRPLEPAQPIRDIVEAFKARYPATESQFSWYADEAHYQDDFPEDHTPYSMTGYPVPDPQWWVCATDIMAVAIGGTAEAQRQFDYWLAEAKAGRMPWLKYLIWDSRLYDVRNNWEPVANSGHFDHIHMSTRTDFLHTGIGSWDPFGVDMPLTDDDIEKVADRVIAKLFDHILDSPSWGFTKSYDEMTKDVYHFTVQAAPTGNPPPATGGFFEHTHDGGETGPAIPATPPA